MRKLCLCALLAAACAFSGVSSSLLAQGAKDGPSKSKNGTIEINESEKDGKFRIAVRNPDGKYLVGSLGFATEKDALKAVDELKAVLAKGAVVKHKADGDDKKDKKKDKKDK